MSHADAQHDAAQHGGHGRHDKHAGHDPEAFRRKFWLSLVLTVPIVATSHMVMDWFGYQLDFPGIDLVGPTLGTVVFGYGGWPFLQGAVREIRDRAPGMMLLIAMAITVAYVASLATALGAFDLDFWWELAALVTIMLLGHWQEMKAIGQARGALSALAALLPDDAERLDPDGQPQRVPATDLRVGDVVLVRPGTRVPADGRVVEGQAEVDESMITGESRPVSRSPDDRVVAGTVATDAALRVRIEAVGDDTALAGVQRLVAQAQQSSGRAQVLADRFAAGLFYIATATALVTLAVWSVLGNLDEAVVRTVTVLVIACPHALGLAIPLVIALSTSVAAKSGILIKDRLALERMRSVDTVLFDKTGTLTRGQHTVTGVAAAGPGTTTAGPGTTTAGPGTTTAGPDAAGVSEQDVLAIAAAVEADSEHSLARAIVTAAGQQPDRRAARGFHSLTGRGVRAQVDGVTYAVGGPALLRELDATVPGDLADREREWSRRGAAVLYLLRLSGDRAIMLGALALEDEVRPEARQAIADLRQQGIRKIVMITGDARPVAEAVAADLGFRSGEDEVLAEVLPADKDDAVTQLQRRGLRVAMVGDGVNDAPALARANVGIAIGAGTDVAIESAGVVLASSDPRGVTGVIRLSRATYRKMIQNLAWAAGYNVVALPLAAGVLAWAGVTLSPAVAAVLMSASTIVVALNAQLLRRVELRPPD
ncbi:Cu2+-exporting ATPase [Micromonospora phaseoli]|uniref:Cu2+-exporting ATPase n=1 Tax=Micromonospora phaseoli TaxID=1144548 RepID=A0A1H7ADZ8_9ACTN|nr:heavy metal translocating P-type ATPase [Micromonospora phaseoli]PZV96464.1 Cu2+-exporting ATPase [Micromonospora phaseoli]GIJ76152.1 putative copper-transporting ATPase [Micromonospora phaseoli]SEJ63166.1 Cu2+-exporting ATPase [Micromonospora phaseoli]